MTCDNCGSEAVRGGRICFVCNRMVNGEPTRPHDEAWVKAEIEWNEAQDKKGGTIEQSPDGSLYHNKGGKSQRIEEPQA